ncbi:glycosyltransferase [Actinoplanes bogorensis]|uniref:Glycosyltransferase n=1 Tax=Paractinoplanes bogorensis TaxID=1610840 RepID=A0ABS5YXB1_9ACTN|nr:glycosyltransferase [Actinoplanes bogorensis]MBU2668083.1 glycosyltransferase [Actinoplanes bogorensis]
MRIAHVTDVYLPRVGGVELQVHDLAARQQARGDDPIVVTTTASGPVVVAGDVPARRLATDGGPYRMVRGRTLADTLRGLDVQLVHAHISAFSPLAWTAARLAAETGVPTVVSVHSMWTDILPLVRRYARWQRARQWPVSWSAVSSVAAAVVREALDGTGVAVVPNGIDPAAWHTPPGFLRPGPPTLISVMRMVRRKRPDALLDLLLDLRHDRPGRFRAVLVGDGPLLPRLQQHVIAAGAGSDIRLTGALERPAIRRLLSTASLYVAPAPRESFGIAALEARSAGVPVLARAESGVADFIRPGVEGWLADSEQTLGLVIDGLLDDPDRLAAVARHNRGTAPSVDWQVVLDATDALYERAIRTSAYGVGLVR